MAIAAGLAIGAAALVPGLILPVDADQGWLLHAAGRLLDGATLGREVADVNPPLIFWLEQPVVALARAGRIHPGDAWQAAVLVSCVLATFLTLGLLRGHALLGTPARAAASFAVLLAVLVLAPLHQRGQREHLSVLLVLPWIVVGARRIEGTKPAGAWAVLAGVLAGLGFALKPFFLLPLALLELRHRRAGIPLLRPDTLAIIAVGVAYACLVLGLEHDWIASVRELAPVYRAYLRPEPSVLLARTLMFAWPAILAIPAWALARRTGADDAPTGSLVVAGAGFLLSALVQLKGWSYLWVPAFVFGTLALVLLGTQDRSRAVRGVALLGLVLAGVAVGRGTISLFARALEFRADPASRFRLFRDALAERARGGPALILSTSHGEIFPVVWEAGATWPLRDPSLWPLAAFHPEAARGGAPISAPPDPLPAMERAWLDRIAADLEATPPAVIVWVPSSPAAARGVHPVRRFDYPTYLRHDPRLRVLLDRYVAADTVGGVVFALPRSLR
ncbi:MAG: hypothetical protein ACREMH_09450 [Gemmatimonadales bacterium]